MSDTFLINQITVIEAQILEYQAAITAVTTGGMEQYTIDTGQTRMTVTSLNVGDLQDDVDGLLSRREILKAQCEGGGAVQGVPYR